MFDYLNIIAKCLDLDDVKIPLKEKLKISVEYLIPLIKPLNLILIKFDQFAPSKFSVILKKGENEIYIDDNILNKILIVGNFFSNDRIYYFPIKDVFFIYGVLIVKTSTELTENEIKFLNIFTRFLSSFFKKEIQERSFKERLRNISEVKRRDVGEYLEKREFSHAKDFILKLFSVQGRNNILKLFFLFLAYEFKISKGIFFIKEKRFIPLYGFNRDEFNFINIEDALLNFKKISFNHLNFNKKIRELKTINYHLIKFPFCLIELKEDIFKLNFSQINIFPIFLKNRYIGLLIVDNVKNLENIYKISLLCEIVAGALYYSKKINELKTIYKKLKITDHNSLLEMLGEISHEIKNPVVSIAGFSKRLVKNFEKLSKERILEYVKIINEEAEKLENLLNDILIFSKTDRISLKPLKLVDVIKEVIESFKEEAQINDIRIVFEFSCDGKIFGNKNLLKQVFANIIRNSIEAIEKNGYIYINLKRGEDFCIISIEDTGGGIPKEIIKRIFEPFFTTKEYGTGLGLSISYRIIQQHGGNIEVGNSDRGAIFTIKFPCRG